MAGKSKIEWTDATWPIVQGCDPVSQGCVHCYAVPLLWRMMHNPDPKISGPLQGLVEKHVNAAGEEILRFTGKVALRKDRLMWPIDWRKPRMIFVPSHGDLFHKGVPDEFILDVFTVMAIARQHTFQVLTKRADRMCEFVSRPDLLEDIYANWYTFSGGAREVQSWPLHNVWLGVSAEQQQEADERIPPLMATPAAVRFVSLEPLLGPIDLECAWHGENALSSECWGDCGWCEKGYPPLYNCRIEPRGEEIFDGRSGLDWVIVGGESGKTARPIHPDWVLSLRDQCRDADVPFFFKQWGRWLPMGQTADGTLGKKQSIAVFNDDGGSHRDRAYDVGKKHAGRLLDGVEHNAFPQVRA